MGDVLWTPPADVRERSRIGDYLRWLREHRGLDFADYDVVKPPRFNAYYPIEDVRPVDAAAWRLELAGRIADKRPWRADEFNALPQQELIIRHICVEGWDYIGQWSGVNFRTFLERIGADLTAKYVAFKCADDYTESLDMATALHPQTILATKYARRPSPIPLGSRCVCAPRPSSDSRTRNGLRPSRSPTRSRARRSERGFNWFSGI